MKTRLLSLPLLLALVASLAACGGGTSVPANDVAMVDGTPITVAQFNTTFKQAIAQVTAGGQTAPTPGTSEYTTLHNQVVAYLVQVAEVNQQAPKEGVSVSAADVQKFTANLISTNFGGSKKKFHDWLKQQGLTEATAEPLIKFNLLTTKIKAKVIKAAKVTEAQEKQFYDTNRTQFMTPAKLEIPQSKKLANTIEQKLQNGANFAALAKKYSQDPGSASQGGKYIATKGQVVPAYEKAAFSLKTGELSAPIDATSAANGGYGFFIIKALGPVKKTGGQETRSVEHILVAVKTKPVPESFAAAQPTIHQQLLTQAQTTLWEQWLAALQKNYKGKVSYQSGYAPPATTALTQSIPTTTG